MPGKKKGKGRPAAPPHSDSLRQDIEAAQGADGDGSFDLAADLLAALDARDAAEAAIAADETSGSQGSSALATPALAAEPSGPVPIAAASSSGSSLHAKDTNASVSVSPTKRISQDLKSAGSKLIGGLRGRPSSKDGADSSANGNSSTGGAAAAQGSSSSTSSSHQGLSSFFHARPSPPSTSAGSPGADAAAAQMPMGSGFGATRKPNRAKARLQRREAANDALRQEAEMELKANGGQPDLAAREREGMEALCKALKREMHEVEPDGHCLYAAVADQLNVLGGTASSAEAVRFPDAAEGKGALGRGALTYRDTRRAAAKVMRESPDDFKPFISDSDEKLAGVVDSGEGAGLTPQQQQDRFYVAYCDAVENTGVWGGQPEILALSRAYKKQINVVQVGYPTLRVGEDEFGGSDKDEAAVYISYHRKMYGLGEHYNSLRKRV